MYMQVEYAMRQLYVLVNMCEVQGINLNEWVFHYQLLVVVVVDHVHIILIE